MKYVPLYRVSTEKQGFSGLGLKAQRSAVETYIKATKGILLNDFIEKESAANKDRFTFGKSISLDSLLHKRPVLRAAIDYARANDAVLIVKEISRLTRFKLLYEYLVNTGVKFLCADYPNDPDGMLTFRLSHYQEEAYHISQRTKLGLAQSTKPKGVKGTKNLLNVNHKARVKAIREAANNNPNTKKASGYICSLRKQGLTYDSIAVILNKEGFLSPNGGLFSKGQVLRMYVKYCA